MDNLLYIGLNGLAGSGKDTAAKMLKTILDYDWKDLEECKEWYSKHYTNPTISATFNSVIDSNSKVMCIAYADQLKNICANIFGIPVSRFYANKSNAWICITHNFEYTESEPDNIVTAEEFYNQTLAACSESGKKYWMSLRETLVYIGTYVLQQEVSKSIFVNIVRNTINEKCNEFNNLKYVIVTDIRFPHELEFIKENSGITMTIQRSSVKQLENIAEHSMYDDQDFDYVISNDGTYDEMFEQIWTLVHTNVIFKNETLQLHTRDNMHNYLRLTSTDNGYFCFTLCTEMLYLRVAHNNGSITMIDPAGGPAIGIGSPIELKDTEKYLVPVEINYNTILGKFIIVCDSTETK